MSNGRKKKFFLNMFFALTHQIITILCGFILPKLIILYYGSEVNGLVSSITQYLGLIVIGECGISSVTQSALYKPLADNDVDSISKIVISSQRFYRKLGYILICYVAVLCIIYPLIVNKNFDAVFTIILILSIALSSFAQYYFSMAYRNLITANQTGYINMILQTITVVLNTIIGSILIINDFSIQLVKFVSSLIFLIQPFILWLYVKRKFNLNKKVVIEEEPIKQKWNGVAQHVSSVILDRTDVVVLTVFSLVSVSIYNVYYLVVNGVKNLVESLSSGITSLFGNIYAKEEDELLNDVFSKYEVVFHMIFTIIFCCLGFLIIPFVSVYTKGIDDANYVLPVFGALITIAFALLTLRIPYDSIIKAAGHYKQTQWSFFVEASLNVIISTVLVFIWGINGVAIGTIIAMLFRTVFCIIYLKRNILKRKVSYFIKNVIVDLICFFIVLAVLYFVDLSCDSYLRLVILGVEVFVITAIVVLSINFIFYRKTLVESIKKIIGKD